MDQERDALHSEDVAWATLLATGDRTALARYERELAPVIAAHLRRQGLDDDRILDVQQTLRLRLFGEGAIARYEGRAALKSWILVSAIREALRVRAKAMREPAVEEEALIALADRGDALHSDAGKQRYRELFKRAFRTSLAALAPRDRVLLRMTALDGLSIDEIGLLQGVHRATAARWIERARETLARQIRKEVMQILGSDPFETEDVLRWVQSRIELSLSAFGEA